MGNFIINKLLENNIEFNILYNVMLSKNQIHTFDCFYDVLSKYKIQINKSKSSTSNEKVNENFITLKDIFEKDLNLMSPYLVAIHLVKAIQNKQIIDEKITEKPKIVYGKQYLTKNFHNVYDCISVWIETKKYIIDPILEIVVDLKCKNKLFYKDIFSRNNYYLDFKSNNYRFALSGIEKYEDKKNMVCSNYVAPKNIKELFADEYKNKNDSTLMRNFLKKSNPEAYKRLMFLINVGKVKDLSTIEQFKKYEKIKIGGLYNEDLTLGKALRKGLNYGRCGLFAKLFSNTVFENQKHKYVVGNCDIVIGSKNSNDGNHTWLEVDDMIIDTSLLMAIPMEFKDVFGYNTEKVQEINKDADKNKIFNDEVDIEMASQYYDLLFENKKNDTKIFKYDFSEDLREIVNNQDLYSEGYQNIISDIQIED